MNVPPTVTVAPVSVLVVVILNARVYGVPTPFDACTVKLDTPAAVGVPVIAPVDGFSDKPFGRLPTVTLHAIVPPPVAARVWLYDVPAVPFGRFAVVILGSANTLARIAGVFGVTAL